MVVASVAVAVEVKSDVSVEVAVVVGVVVVVVGEVTVVWMVVVVLLVSDAGFVRVFPVLKYVAVTVSVLWNEKFSMPVRDRPQHIMGALRCTRRDCHGQE